MNNEFSDSFEWILIILFIRKPPLAEKKEVCIVMNFVLSFMYLKINEFYEKRLQMCDFFELLTAEYLSLFDVFIANARNN